jgi:hypothetical protein
LKIELIKVEAILEMRNERQCNVEFRQELILLFRDCPEIMTSIIFQKLAEEGGVSGCCKGKCTWKKCGVITGIVTVLIVLTLAAGALRDRFYESPFRPKALRTNYHSQIFGHISIQKQRAYVQLSEFY